MASVIGITNALALVRALMALVMVSLTGFCLGHWSVVEDLLSSQIIPLREAAFHVCLWNSRGYCCL
jgi:hypothetical protein